MYKSKIIAFALVACCQFAWGLQINAADKTVTTVKDWVGGATTLYGRMTSTGITSSTISRQGFCYATTSLPTIADNVATAYIDNNGRIYKMTNLTPATVYYIRAFVETKTGDVIYGQPIKAITRPQVNGVSYGIRDGFPSDALTRIQAAAAQAQQLWNEYTGIRGLYVNIGYGADTPTADCSYGGWMRVGPNSAYQATGTLLHEMLHAIGVGTVSLWYGPNSYLRQNGSSGYWLGPRATRVVRFWDNDTTAYLKGDKTHMWPYGVNGAHEDTKTEKLYVGNSLLAEALGEDGLPTTTSQFAIPAYVFEQNDTAKYYIKNEAEENGLYTSCLAIGTDGRLSWKAMTSKQALANDSAAWNITFNPATCLYSLKNVATGKYISYSHIGTDGFIAKVVTTPGETESLHFLPSSVNVQDVNQKGYWVSYVKDNTATSLVADKLSKTTAKNMSFTADAQSQRWLIQDAEGFKALDNQLQTALQNRLSAARVNVDSLIAYGQKFLATPHVEEKEDADQTLTTTLSTIQTKLDAATTVETIEKLETETKTALYSFLSKVTPKSVTEPFDITYMMVNPSIDSSDGWSEEPTINYSCGEFFKKTFSMTQAVKLPKGTFKLCVQAFERPGTTSNVYKDYQAGTDNVTTTLIALNEKVKIKNIIAGVQSKQLGGKEVMLATNVFVPNDMEAASHYFAKGLYDNSLVFSVSRTANITMGLSNATIVDNDWTIFDNFRLYYYGTIAKDDVTSSINAITTNKELKSSAARGVYGFNGVLISKDASVIDQLPAGLYIVNGKKVIIN